MTIRAFFVLAIKEHRQERVTREGRLMFFFQFLHVGGRWEEFLRQSEAFKTPYSVSGNFTLIGNTRNLTFPDAHTVT